MKLTPVVNFTNILRTAFALKTFWFLLISSKCVVTFRNLFKLDFNMHNCQKINISNSHRIKYWMKNVFLSFYCNTLGLGIRTIRIPRPQCTVRKNIVCDVGLKLRCDSRFQRAFTACSCVFKVITLIWVNQRNFFENTTACSKRMRKTLVATQLKDRTIIFSSISRKFLFQLTTESFCRLKSPISVKCRRKISTLSCIGQID